MITEVELKIDGIKIPRNKITILVGANHSGKTLFLQELQSAIGNPSEDNARKLINKVSLQEYKLETVKELLAELGYQSGTPGSNRHVSIDGQSILVDHAGKTLSLFTKYLDIQNRLSLINGAQNTSLKESPRNALQTILRCDDKRKKIREKIKEALGFYLTLDITNPSTIRLRASRIEPTLDDERSIKDGALVFHKNTKDIIEYSDGIKSYIGILLSLYGDRHKIILIDEPEAFLHPPLAYKLGKDITTYASEFDKEIFIATHNAEFLMGCLEATQEISIVRFGYNEENNKSSCNVLPKDFLKSLLLNPVIRHSNFISSLFYKCAIICEADKDRVFYREINQRLIDEGQGIKDCLFINSPNGKTNLKHFSAGIAKLGIPFVIIVDFDIIDDGMTELLQSLDLQPEQIRSIQALANPIKDFCRENGISVKSGGMKNIIDVNKKTSANQLIENLKYHGIFVVPCGELEYWLEEYGVSPAHKNTWLSEIFEKIGLAPGEKNYVKPDSKKDVWEFMVDIANWLKKRSP